MMTVRIINSENSKPRFARHVRFRFDERRQRWVVLAPERMVMPDEISVQILKRCTGDQTLAAVIDDLVAEFDAPREEIAADVLALIQDLTDQGILGNDD